MNKKKKNKKLKYPIEGLTKLIKYWLIQEDDRKEISRTEHGEGSYSVKYDKPSYRQMACILLLTFKKKVARKVYLKLNSDEIEAVTFEIARMDVVPRKDYLWVMQQHHEWLQNSKEYGLQGGMDKAKELINNSYGKKRTNKVINRLTSSLQVRPFDFIKRTDPKTLGLLLVNEPNQTIAIVLSYLEDKMANKILDVNFELGRATIIIELMENIGEVNPDILREIERVLERKIATKIGE